MNDLQIVSGLAILISGYYAVVHGASVYHWKMIIQLAWFSTITHLGALSCLRSYLYRNKVKRSLRLIFTLSLAAMLIVAIISTAPSSSNSNALPASCLFADLSPYSAMESFHAADVSFSILMLVYNIVLRIIKLHRKVLESGLLWIRRKLTHPVKRILVDSAPFRFIVDRKRSPKFQLFLYIMFVQRFIAALIVFDVYWLMASSAVGEVRNSSPMCPFIFKLSLNS